MRAYHIDRKNSLRENDIIRLQKFTDIEPAYLNDVIENEYPEGLTRHGDQYFASALVSEATVNSGLIEMFFEQRRLLKFPDKHSRFQSVFATETIEEATLWKNHLGLKECTLWEIEFDHNNFIKVDSSWLSLGVHRLSFLHATMFADNYWSQVIHSNSRPELLIKPPVRIIRKINFG
ncbi:hypothetical protein D3C76_1119160 [compost metagenome]